MTAFDSTKKIKIIKEIKSMLGLGLKEVIFSVLSVLGKRICREMPQPCQARPDQGRGHRIREKIIGYWLYYNYQIILGLISVWVSVKYDFI